MNYGRQNITQKKKQLNSSTKKLGTKFGVAAIKLLLITLVAVVVSASCLVLGSMQGIIASAPDVDTIDVTPDGYATKIYDNSGTEIQSLSSSGANRISVKIDKVPESLQNAFIAIEDERFYEHNGIDIKGIVRAAYITLSNGKLSQGASTLTQQLLKNNVFNAYNETTMEKIKRKVQEQYLAVKLETFMDKRTILENYLNTINLGNGYYGVQAAANGYFGKDVSELTLSECAVIASITQNPSKLNPIKYPESNKKRQLNVLDNMLAQGYISKNEYDEAANDDVYARLQGLEVTSKDSTYSYFVDTVIDQLIKDLVAQKGYTETQATNLIYRGGLQVFTTQDTQMQEIADRIINDPGYYPENTQCSISYSLTIREADNKISNYSHLYMLDWFQKQKGLTDFNLIFDSEEQARSYVEQFKAGMLEAGGSVVSEKLSFSMQPQMSLTLMDQHTGEVKVIVGGRGEKTANRTLNRATGSKRQPGSCIKPLAVYGPALDTGAITLATVVDDAPYYYSGANGKLVKNHDNSYSGLITVRKAIANSTNVPAVKILTQISPEVGFNYLQKLHFSTLVSPKEAVNGNHDVVQALALGGMTYGVYCIDMTAAYAAVANNGVYTEPVYYTKVLDHNGTVILDNSTPNTTAVFKESTAWLLTSALESVADYGTGTQAHLKKQPTAVKTGTTQNASDKWICGFTPYYTASIWLGYDDSSEELTIHNHNIIWHDIMEEIHKNLPEGSFDAPNDIVSMSVCDQSGAIPVEGLCDEDPRGSRIINEYFSLDNKPVGTCETHIKVKVCEDSNEPASVNCTHIATRIFIKKAAVNIQPNASSSSSSINMTPKDSNYALTDEQINKICSLHSGNSPYGDSYDNDILKPSQSQTESNGNNNNSNNATSADSSNNSGNAQNGNNSNSNSNSGNVSDNSGSGNNSH